MTRLLWVVLLTLAAVLTAPTAHAGCPEGQSEDPMTRMCWSQSGDGIGYSNPCQPGRVGDCVGVLRENPLANPPPPRVLPDPADLDPWLGGSTKNR